MLIEVLIAILIFAIGVLAVVGMQAIAISNVADTKYRLDAGAAANEQIAKMWVDQANMGSYAGTVSVPSLPNGQMQTTVAGNDITIVVNWKPPNAPIAHTFSTTTSIYGN